ncbi:trypsin-like peptidase domain-containing protein [Corynebacterium lizhenjunii]|uniref:Trypsin-like peptidase domain-containing protein n=1 Tax=Corynebacterium lizhenjunii TaxID=2709394 RepID=A0A7T0KGM1_9CORY|nr:serine protease [Corynebacterium lizhenjunii]QPK80182.1 trypsin-like peptidase domain-containing protein [Corynebacterium lizhenjunii]
MVHAVRIRHRGSTCSGVLVSPTLRPGVAATHFVLTCAHFFATSTSSTTPPGTYLVEVPLPGRPLLRIPVAAVRTIDGTDLAVVRLQRPTPPVSLAAFAAPTWGQRLETCGFGGLATSHHGPATRPGRLWLQLPLAWSRTSTTRVRHALVLRSCAIKGDSGGPVCAATGAVVGIQSLILDPFGHNLGLATAAAVQPHRRAILSALGAL